MTVSSATNKSGPYSGNGVTTVFAYGFRILDATHIQVVTTTGGTDTIVSASAYSVSGVGNTSGGNVTFTTAPATGTTINLIRNAPFTQGVDLENQGAYYAETVEQAFDLAAMRDQQLQEQISRSVKIPVGEDASTLDTLIPDVIRLADSAANIDTVAGISANVTTVAGISGNVTTVAGISGDVTSVAGVSASVPTVASISANVTTVAGVAPNVTTVAGVAASVTTVAGISANVTTVAGIAPNVTTVAGVAADVPTVAGISANVTTVAGIAPNVTTVAGVAPNVTTVAGVSANVTTVAGISANVTTVAGISAAVSTVAANVADVTNFSDVYLGPKAANPTLRNDGTALLSGDLYFNTTIGLMRAYDGTTWIAASSSVNGTSRRQSFTATAGQTVFTITGGYDPQFADVYLNGVKLVNGVDVTVSSGTDVVLTVGAAAGDSVDVVAYGTFQLSDFYTKTESDNRYVQPVHTGNVDITGEFIADSYNETFVAVTGTTPAVNCETGNVFALTTSGNTTFTFTNPPATGTAYGFTLKVTAGGAHTLTWPASVDWAGGTAPDAPASGAVNVYAFVTHDGGTNWYGFLAGAALA